MTENLFKGLHDTETRNSILDRSPPLPEDAKTWLGRLTLLYGVPFHYLVPDERMLPAESLRFFYVDPSWMEALLDGALSIGRSEDVRVLLNKVMAGTYTRELIAEARNIRRQQQAGADEKPEPLPPSPVEGSFKFSGFLLRSEIVDGWRGLAVNAFPSAEGRTAGAPLVTLRLERLARDVLFGLVEGHLRSLEILQPPEGLHFQVGDGTPRRAGDSRVIDVTKYAEQLASDRDNSADFAVSLLAQQARYTFKIED